jgi:hypothetical protein
MARKRGEPAIPSTGGKELLDPPVYPSFPSNTPKTTSPSKNPDGVPEKKPDREQNEDQD